MSILSHPLTYADLEREREARDERLELIEGELFVTPSPTPLHQLVVHRLAVLLDRAIVEPGRGVVLESPLDVFLDEQSIVQPDLVVLLGERTALIGETNVAGPPSLVIEIASPSTASNDLGRKLRLYAQHGIPEYWFVDPATRQVSIYSSPAGGRYRTVQTSADIAVSATIPGLSVDLPALFASVTGR